MTAQCVILETFQDARRVKRHFEARNIRLRLRRLRQAGYSGLIDNRDIDNETDDQLNDGAPLRVPGFRRGLGQIAIKKHVTRWCGPPEQRKDGKWFIPIPNNGQGRRFFLEGMPNVPYVIRTYNANWIDYPSDINQ